jgi:quinoprotein glucose dehydrogenase
MCGRLPRFLTLATIVAWASAGIWSQSAYTDNDWATYGGDLGNNRYRPFDQVNASNFDQLEVAWRFKTDIFGTHPEYKLEGTPLMVNGVLYATVGSEGNNERFASRVL